MPVCMHACVCESSHLQDSSARLQHEHPPLFKARDVHEDVAHVLVRVLNVGSPIHPRHHKALEQHSPASEFACVRICVQKRESSGRSL